MKKPLGTILIVAALAIGYLGFNKVSNSGGSVEVVGIELSAEDSGAKTQGFIMLGVAALVFVGGIGVVNKS